MSESTCQERVQSHFESRMEDLRLLWAGYIKGDCPTCGGDGYITSDDVCEVCDGTGQLSEDVPDLGSLYEYGLSFDYVAPHTFEDQKEGYFRYQLSWGGPSDEFRIYVQKIDDWKFSVDNIEYWFLDWFDGAKVNLWGDELDFIENLFQSFFVNSGSAAAQFDAAMQDYEYEEDEED